MDVGKEFSSWESFIHALDHYSKEHKVVYIVGTCKPVETANRNDSLENKFPNKFKYCFARLVCKYYGSYSSRSTSFRPHERTCKTWCSSSILVLVNKKRTALVIKEANLQHIHDVSENIFSSYLQKNCRLQAEDRCMASVLLRSGVPLSRVQEFISNTSNTASTVKDLQNVETSIKSSGCDKEGRNFAFLTDLDQLMAEDSESIVEMINFTLAPAAIYLQTFEMTERMKSLSEGHLQIVTHYINDSKLSVISVIGINGELNPHILAFCIVIVDTETAFQPFLEAFVKNNPEFCDSLTGVVLDCSKENVDFLQQLIPQTSVAWSRSYILGQFSEVVNNSTKDIQKNMQLCKELMNASSKSVYEKKLTELLASFHTIDSKEFLRTWDLCTDLWAQYEISSHHELSHQKSAVEMDYINLFKTFVPSSASLSELIRTLLKLSKNEETEDIVKETISFDFDPSYEQYHQLCFTEAAQAVIGQISIALNSVYEFKDQTDMFFVKKKDTGDEFILDISGNKCTCRYFIDTNLPCQHIFAHRRFSNKPLYNELLIPTKWQVFGKSITLDALAESLAQGHIPSSRQHDERLKELQTALKDTLSLCCSHSYEQMGKDLILLKQIYSIMRNNLAHNVKLIVNSEEKKIQPETQSDIALCVVPTRRKRGRPSKKDKLQREICSKSQQEKISLPSIKVQTQPVSMRHNLRTNIKHKFVTRELHIKSEENSNTPSIPEDQVTELEEDKTASAILREDGTELLRIIASKTGSTDASLGQLITIGPEGQDSMNTEFVSSSSSTVTEKIAKRSSSEDNLTNVAASRHILNDRLKPHVKVNIVSSQRTARSSTGSYAGMKRSRYESQNDSTAEMEENEDDDDDDAEHENETEEERKRRKAFLLKRKMHYNEFAAVQLAKKLMAEDDDDEDDQKSNSSAPVFADTKSNPTDQEVSSVKVENSSPGQMSGDFTGEPTSADVFSLESSSK
uniref:SWIM-type domain-containing protein n=1 Tax=Arion vulgaris TaxID=1028688 RepID=A0A0B7AUK6_9EUPU